jgi:hypothetical protein
MLQILKVNHKQSFWMEHLNEQKERVESKIYNKLYYIQYTWTALKRLSRGILQKAEQFHVRTHVH